MSPTSPRADRGSAETERPRPARPGVRRRLAAIHRELDSLAGEPDRWARSLVGGDLWVDGWRAVRSTDEHLFARYRDAFLDFCQQSGAAVRSLDEESLPSVLERFELFLEACAEANAGSFWPALAVGLALVQAVGGPPRIERSPEAAVANDSLLLIVSPSYRAIRCHAYNAGIATFCVPDSQVPVFRPELGHFLISPRYQVRHEPPRVQFYTVNHDLSHLVLFGDAYLRPVGSPAMTAALLLNAEETCCTLDLVLARDLDRFGIELNALAELLRIESGSKAGRPSVTQRVAREPAAFTAYQAALKAAAQERLTASTPVSLRIREGASLPSDLEDWLHPRAQENHASWNEGLAERVWNPTFQRFVSLLPPVEQHLDNLRRFTRETWEPGQPVLEEIPEPCPEARATGAVLYRLRFLVIRAAEVAVELEEAGALSAALADDLTRWALGVVEDFVRVRHDGASVIGEDCWEVHAQAVRGLLERHGCSGGPEGPAARFNHPLAISGRAAAA